MGCFALASSRISNPYCDFPFVLLLFTLLQSEYNVTHVFKFYVMANMHLSGDFALLHQQILRSVHAWPFRSASNPGALS